MKKLMKILLIIGIIIVALVTGFFILLKIGDKKPLVAEDYYQTVSTGGPMEELYATLGSYEVSTTEFEVSGQQMFLWVKKQKSWIIKTGRMYKDKIWKEKNFLLTNKHSGIKM